MKKGEKKENYLLKDSALSETDVKYDFFNHEDLSNEIAELLLNDKFEPPYNIALIGKWGLGKTSLLNLLKRKISSTCKVISINAWKYEKEDLKKVYLKELYSGIKEKPFLLLGSLLKELKKHFQNSEKEICKEINITFKDLGLILKTNWRVIFISLIISIVWQGSIFIANNGNFQTLYLKNIFDIINFYFENILITLIIPILVYYLKKIAEKKEEKNIVQLADIDYYDDYEELIKLEIDKLLEKTNKKKVVIIIDDLDRLSTAKMVETLDVLKTLMELPKCTFIVPFDDTIIKSALDNKVIKDLINEHQIIKSELILDKLFAFKFYLPPILPLDLKEYTLDLVNNHMDGLKKHFEKEELEDIIKDIIIYPGIETPRQIKKILNLYSTNYRILLKRKNNQNVEESVLNNEGKKILAVISVLQADFNEFYDSLFIEPKNIEILMKIHNDNNMSFIEKKEIINESIKYLFIIDEENKSITFRNKNINLLNFLSNVQFVPLSNILPYLYLKQDTISSKYGSKLSIELTNAAESFNLPTVIEKLKEISDQKEIILSIFETTTEHRKLNVISSFCMAYGSINNDIKNEIANKISKELDKAFLDDKLKNNINYNNYNFNSILNIFINTSEENKHGIENMLTTYLEKLDIDKKDVDFVADMINLSIDNFSLISSNIIEKIKQKIIKKLEEDNFNVTLLIPKIDIDKINKVIFTNLFGEQIFEILCGQINETEEDEEKEIISKWLTKVASYYELNDKLTNIVSILSQNENNLKYLNRIFLSNEGEVNEN